jgi:hypothetical protein
VREIASILTAGVGRIAPRSVFDIPIAAIGCTTDSEATLIIRPHLRACMSGSTSSVTRKILSTIAWTCIGAECRRGFAQKMLVGRQTEELALLSPIRGSQDVPEAVATNLVPGVARTR